MKRSKWLLTIPTVAIATVSTTVSCGNNNVMTIEDVEKAIFGPHDVKDPTLHPEGDTYYECLEKANDKERKNELLYAIYAPLFYLKSTIPQFDDAPIYDLWKDGILAFSANISKCSLEVKDSKVIANYVGYVNLIFQKDWDIFTANDFMQFTLLLDNEPVTPEQNHWYLHFINPNPLDPTPLCWGLAQIHHGDATRLFYLNYIGYEPNFDEFPPNYHNWVQ